MTGSGHEGEALRERHAFVRAYARNLRIDPRGEHRAPGLRSVLVLSILTALVALLVGVVQHLTDPDAAATNRSIAGESPYSAVTGWNCSQSASHGLAATGRTADWSLHTSGGWTRNGCLGSYETIPVVHSRDNADAAPIQWWFSAPGAGRRCRLAVWVPSAPVGDTSLASSAMYQILDGRDGQAIAEVRVDQSRSSAAWVALGIYPAGSGGLAVQLAAQLSSPVGGRVAVTQVSLSCARQ